MERRSWLGAMLMGQAKPPEAKPKPEDPLGARLETLRQTLDVNVSGAYRMLQTGARLIERSGGGSIVNLSSIMGLRGRPGLSAYAASKAGINHVTRQLAKFVGKEGLRVNAIAPGNILFEGGVWDRNTKERPEAWDRWIKREVALRRFGTVEEIADAALFLASPRASFITGEVLVVDGGQVR